MGEIEFHYTETKSQGIFKGWCVCKNTGHLYLLIGFMQRKLNFLMSL